LVEKAECFAPVNRLDGKVVSEMTCNVTQQTKWHPRKTAPEYKTKIIMPVNSNVKFAE